MGVLAYFVFLRTSRIEYVPQTPDSLSLRAAAARLISSLETPVKFEKSQIFVGNVRSLKGVLTHSSQLLYFLIQGTSQISKFL